MALNGCSSDSTAKGGGDSGAGGAKSTGGRKSTGGGTSAGGKSGGTASGGAGGTAAGGLGGATTCTSAVETACDGPEDCPSGQRCCGEYNQGGYDKFGCYASCSAPGGAGGAGGAGGMAAMTMGPILFELCHPGDTCEDSTAQCLTSSYLPNSLSRCLPSMLVGVAMGSPPDASLGQGKNQVNCGTDVCGSTQKCCVRQPLGAYCAPKSDTCVCNPKMPEGGTPDAASGG
jgi:hypothetical protein